MKFKEFSFASYAVTDVPRARAFYEGVLGLTAGSVYESDGMAFIEYAVGPNTLTIGMGAPGFSPGKTGAIVTLEVEGDFAAVVDELRAKKVKLLMEPMDTGPCWMTTIEDPDGNQIMIHKRKEA